MPGAEPELSYQNGGTDEKPLSESLLRTKKKCERICPWASTAGEVGNITLYCPSDNGERRTMARKHGGAAVLMVTGVMLLACGVEIDLSQLEFQDPSPVGEDTVVVDTAVPDEAIDCAFIYHCMLDELGSGNDPFLCQDLVVPGELMVVGAVENCREKQCVSQDQVPGSPGFDDESFTGCIMRRCWSELTECAVGHGEMTCLEFSKAYKEYTDGSSNCAEATVELCILGAMHKVKKSHEDGMRLLLDCIHNEVPYGIPYESCQAKCAVSGN